MKSINKNQKIQKNVLSKKMIILSIIFLILSIFLIYFYSKNKTKEFFNPSQIQIDLSLTNFDDIFLKLLQKKKNTREKTSSTSSLSKKNLIADQDLIEIGLRYPMFAKYYLGVEITNIKDISKKQLILENLKKTRRFKNLIKLLNSRYQKELFIESNRIFADLKDIREEFINAFKRIKFFFPQYILPQIIIFSTSLGNDILIDKNCIIIDLSYFFGKESTYLPSMPEYLIDFQNPKNVVMKSILLLAATFNKYDIEDISLLSSMIYYGKVCVFTKNILPYKSYEEMLSYNSEDIKYIKRNESSIWCYIINNQLLYNKDKICKSHFIDELPFNIEFGKKSPGKIGRWYGIKIVSKFIENNKKDYFINCIKHSSTSIITSKAKDSFFEIFHQYILYSSIIMTFSRYIKKIFKWNKCINLKKLMNNDDFFKIYSKSRYNPL